MSPRLFIRLIAIALAAIVVVVPAFHPLSQGVVNVFLGLSIILLSAE